MTTLLLIAALERVAGPVGMCEAVIDANAAWNMLNRSWLVVTGALDGPAYGVVRQTQSYD